MVSFCRKRSWLTKDVKNKLEQHLAPGKRLCAISGHDLAQLVVQRLTNADFNVEIELKKILL